MLRKNNETFLVFTSIYHLFEYDCVNVCVFLHLIVSCCGRTDPLKHSKQYALENVYGYKDGVALQCQQWCENLLSVHGFRFNSHFCLFLLIKSFLFVLLSSRYQLLQLYVSLYHQITLMKKANEQTNGRAGVQWKETPNLRQTFSPVGLFSDIRFTQIQLAKPIRSGNRTNNRRYQIRIAENFPIQFFCFTSRQSLIVEFFHICPTTYSIWCDIGAACHAHRNANESLSLSCTETTNKIPFKLEQNTTILLNQKQFRANRKDSEREIDAFRICSTTHLIQIQF